MNGVSASLDSKIMSKDRKIETKNQHEEQLDGILFMFVYDEMDYDISQNEIIEIIRNHTLNAINKIQEMRKSGY